MRTKLLPLAAVSILSAFGLGMGAGCSGGYVPPIDSSGGAGLTATVLVESVPSGASISVNGMEIGYSRAMLRVRLDETSRVKEDLTIHLQWPDRDVDYELRSGSAQPSPTLRINQNGGEAF
jgi:hypothetical protein